MMTESVQGPPPSSSAGSGSADPVASGQAGEAERRKLYWKANLKLMFKLLIIWFCVSYGCGILLVEPLNEVRVGGYKLGFWFAQQGSMYTFVALIFYYAKRMAALDRKFDLEE